MVFTSMWTTCGGGPGSRGLFLLGPDRRRRKISLWRLGVPVCDGWDRHDHDSKRRLQMSMAIAVCVPRRWRWPGVPIHAEQGNHAGLHWHTNRQLSV